MPDFAGYEACHCVITPAQRKRLGRHVALTKSRFLMPSKSNQISLSLDTWIKIVLFLFVHGGVFFYAAWQLSQQYEHRLTMLETNQKIIMLEIVKGLHD